MNIIYTFNEYNFKDNIKNIENFNYLRFNHEQWENIANKLAKVLPREYDSVSQLNIEATKVNPIVKVMYNSKYSQDTMCVKLTPYEVMAKINDDRFKYSRALTKIWQSILTQEFGQNYEDAKNLHYGIIVKVGQ